MSHSPPKSSTLSAGATKALKGLQHTTYLSKLKDASDHARKHVADKWRLDPRIAFIDNLDELLAETVVLVYDRRTTSRKELMKQVRPYVRQVLPCEDLEDFHRKMAKYNSDPQDSVTPAAPPSKLPSQNQDPLASLASKPGRNRLPINLIFAEYDEKTLQLLKHVNSRIKDKYLRKMPLVPVIITAKSQVPPEQAQQCMDLGAVTIITKPVPREDLLKCLAMTIRKSHMVHEVYKDISTEKAVQRYPKFQLKELRPQEKDAILTTKQALDGAAELLNGVRSQEGTGQDDGTQKETTLVSEDEEDGFAFPQAAEFIKKEKEEAARLTDVSQLFTNIWVKPDVEKMVQEENEELSAEQTAQKASQVLGGILKEGSGRNSLGTSRSSFSSKVPETPTILTRQSLKEKANRVRSSNKVLLRSTYPLTDPRRRPHMYNTDINTKELMAAKDRNNVDLHPDMKYFVQKTQPPKTSPRTIGGLSKSKVETVKNVVTAIQDARTGINRGARDIDKLVVLSKDPRMMEALSMASPQKKNAHLSAKFGLKWKKNAQQSARSKPGDLDGSRSGKRKVKPLLGDVPRYMKETSSASIRQLNTPKSTSRPSSRSPTSCSLASEVMEQEADQNAPTMSLHQLVVNSLASKKMVENMIEFKHMAIDVLPAGLTVIEPQSHGSGASYFVISGFKKLQRKDYNGALEILNKAVKKEPRNFTAYSVRGQIYGFRREYFKAVIDFNHAIEYGKGKGLLTSALAGILFNRSVCSLCVGDDEMAISDLQEAVTLDPHNIQYRHNFALALRRSGQYNQAQEEYLSLWVQNEKSRRDKEEEAAMAVRLKFEDSLTVVSKPQLNSGRITSRRPKTSPQPTLNHGAGSIHNLLKWRDDACESKSHNSSNSQNDSLGSPVHLTRSKDSRVARIRTASSVSDLDQLNNISAHSLSNLIVGSTLKRKMDLNHDGRVDLAEYKSMLGQSMDFFDQIFCQPSDFQISLTATPSVRTATQLSYMEPVIKSIPLFLGLPMPIVRQLCKVVEYRTLNKTETCFNQGDPVDACCVVLSGRLIIKMVSDPDLPNGNVTMNVGELGAGDSFGDTELVMNTKKPKFLSTYYVEEPTEVLLVLKHDFDSLLKDHVYDRLKRKYQVLKQSGIFKAWEVGEVLRLASMAQIKVFRRNHTIVKQATQPSSLFFLIKGVCRVTKYPDREAQINRKVQELNKELQRIKLKYTYHHDLRGQGVDQYINKWGPKHNTHSELKKLELENEIKVWQDRLKELKEKEHRKRSPGLGEAGHLVATLVPPACFGEMSVLDPTKGVALGSVVSETLVETLMIHKIIMQTFDITEDLLEKLTRKSVKYPDDIDLAEMMENDDHWLGERKRIVEQMKLNKTKIQHIKPADQVKIRNPLTLPDIAKDTLN